jgi:hypothetical protein
MLDLALVFGADLIRQSSNDPCVQKCLRKSCRREQVALSIGSMSSIDYNQA